MKKIENINLPNYSEWYLEKLAYRGARSIHGEDLPKCVENRLKYELEVIVEKGLTDYFLIVQDWINTARQDFDTVFFPLGCNVSGSLVAYCLGISYIDPLQYDLCFERFVQSDDDSIPPICICTDEKTGYQMEWKMKDKYGVDQIPGFKIQTNEMISKLLKVYENIKEIHGNKIDIRKIPLDDSYCFEVFKQGMTDYLGLFSVESRRKDLMRLKPNTFYDIAEYHALYNHEVCQDIELFIKRRHHHIGAEYVIPEMRDYLGSTYGILLYQEQMMMLSRLLADFTREESYELLKRRSDELKAVFLERGEEDGQDPQTLSDIWAEWERKGPYLMSKSQAYDYAFMVYQIAYLRTHYPIEFQMEFPWNSEFRLRIF